MDRIKKTVAFDTPMTTTTPSTLSKWIPLICAGAAAGVSIIALQEIRNLRKEIGTIKGEKNPAIELNKRMENMEEQLEMLSSFITNKKKIKKDTNVIRQAVTPEPPPVQIINDEEYEEIEVTDDEAEESEN
jgi:hypothetical protein